MLPGILKVYRRDSLNDEFHNHMLAQFIKAIRINSAHVWMTMHEGAPASNRKEMISAL